MVTLISTHKGHTVFIDQVGYPLHRSFSRQGVILGETDETYVVNVPEFRGENSVIHIIPKIFCTTLDNEEEDWQY